MVPTVVASQVPLEVSKLVGLRVREPITETPFLAGQIPDYRTVQCIQSMPPLGKREK